MARIVNITPTLKGRAQRPAAARTRTNQQDATLRNVRAAKKRTMTLEEKVEELIVINKTVTQILTLVGVALQYPVSMLDIMQTQAKTRRQQLRRRTSTRRKR